MAHRVHDRIIAAAAHAHLASLGFTQKGRSRLWFADHGWWAVIVEFQPSSWDRGTYLNLAAKWFWAPTPHWSFDYVLNSSRIGGFEQFRDEEQFSNVCERLARAAAEDVVNLRTALVTIDAVADRLSVNAMRGEWQLYHASIAAFLAGRREARRHSPLRSHLAMCLDPESPARAIVAFVSALKE